MMSLCTGSIRSLSGDLAKAAANPALKGGAPAKGGGGSNGETLPSPPEQVLSAQLIPGRLRPRPRRLG